MARGESQNVMTFGAVTYFFAREIFEKYQIPIGIINASVGGTPIEAWISEEGLKDFEDIQKTITQNQDEDYIAQKLAENEEILLEGQIRTKEYWKILNGMNLITNLRVGRIFTFRAFGKTKG